MYYTIKIIELNESFFTYTKVQLAPVSMDKSSPPRNRCRRTA